MTEVGGVTDSSKVCNGEDGEQVIEMIESEVAPSVDEITPLLIEVDSKKPTMNIFSVSYPRRRPKEQITKDVELEVTLLTQCISWTWNGTRYSGLLCIALSSSIYFLMESLVDIFYVGSIPLFEVVFTRCTISLLLSFLWLRQTRQPILGPTHIRKLLVARALIGYLSLLGFIYSIQHLPLSAAVLLSFTSPIMASIAARIILKEKLKLMDIGGLICSYFGLLLLFKPMLPMQGVVQSGEVYNKYIPRGGHPIYAILIGLVSSVTGGISICLIRTAAKASDQPVVTVFAFGVLASPATAICVFAFQDFVLPSFSTFFPMAFLGVLAFFAEVFLARGLQLEKTSKVANLQFIQALLSQIWGIGLMRLAPTFYRVIGCLLILLSVGSTIYFGPEREVSE